MSSRLRLTLIALALALSVGLGALVRSLDLGSPSAGSRGPRTEGPRASGNPQESAPEPEWDPPSPHGSAEPGPGSNPSTDPIANSTEPARSSLPALERQLHLRVVDRLTGEPVPAVELKLVARGVVPPPASTDPSGEANLVVPSDLTSATLRAHDLWARADLEFDSGFEGSQTSRQLRIDFDPPDSGRVATLAGSSLGLGTPEDPLEVSVEVGPTFHLRIEGSRPDLPHIGFLMQGLDNDNNGWPLKELQSTSPDDRGRWVLRYRTSFMELDPHAPRRVVVFTEPETELGERFDWDPSNPPEGVWVGTAEVDVRPGVYPEVLVVELAEQIVLRGRTLGASDEALRGCELLLLRENEPEHLFLGGSTSGLLETSEEDGRFWLPGVTPGSYRLYVRHPDHWPLAFDLDVDTGREDLGDLVLQPVVIGGALAGEVQGPAGVDALVMLNLVCTEGPPYSKTLWLDSDSTGLATFTVPDLPVGTYRLEPLSIPRMEASPPTLRASPPRTDLRFELSAPEDVHPMRIRARDRADGSEVEDLRLIFKISGRWSLEAEPSRDLDSPFWSHDPSDGLETIVWAEGYRALHLDHSDATLEDGHWVWNAEMDRGSSVVLFARHAQAAIGMGKLDLEEEGAEFAARPIEGVELVSRAASLGRTDRDGLLLVPLGPGDVELAARSDQHVLVGSRGLWNGRPVGEDPIVLLWYGDR